MSETKDTADRQAAQTSRPRSFALVLGLVAVTGPVAMLGLFVLGTRFPVMSGAPVVFVGAWCVVCMLLGGAAAVVAVEDLKAPAGTGPRYALAGLFLGLVPAVLVAIALAFVLLLWLTF